MPLLTSCSAANESTAEVSSDLQSTGLYLDSNSFLSKSPELNIHCLGDDLPLMLIKLKIFLFMLCF